MSEVPRDHAPQTATAHVLSRFVLRVVILTFFAATSGRGFAPTVQAMLVMAGLFCLMMGVMRRESPLGNALNNFDEAAAYGACASVAQWHI